MGLDRIQIGNYRRQSRSGNYSFEIGLDRIQIGLDGIQLPQPAEERKLQF